MPLNSLHDGRGIPSEWYSEEAVRSARWLAPFTRRIGEVMEGRGGTEQDSRLALLEDACAEALEALEKRSANPGFLNAWEMVDWVMEVREASDACAGWETHAEFAEKLPVLLLRELTRFDVAFELKPAHTFHPNQYQYLERLPLGGPRQLAIEPTLKDGKFIGIGIRGIVRAPTIDGAIRRTEWLVDEVSGALRVVGLARFVQLPGLGMDGMFGSVELPTALISGAKWGGEPYNLDPAAMLRMSGLSLTIPADLGDLKRALLAEGDLTTAFEHHHRQLRRVLAGTSQRAEELRGACRRLVQAHFASDFGLSVTLAFSALEGLLLEPSSKDEVVGRLSEAVAHGLGGSVDERAQLRRLAKRLYGLRSTFVHTGTASELKRERAEALELAYRVVRREIELLHDEPEGT